MNSKALTFLACVIILSTATAWFGASWAVKTLEKDTSDRIALSMEAAGQNWAKVETDGLIVRLKGAAPDETGRFRALEVAAQIVDTSRITDQTTVATTDQAKVPDFNIEILRNDPALSLIGLVPGKNARLQILRDLEPLKQDGSFTDLLESVEQDAPEGWDEALKVAIKSVAELPRSRVLVKPGGITIEAFLDRPDMLAPTKEAIETIIPKGILLKLELSAPKSVVAPFKFVASKANDAIKISECWSDSEDGRTAIYTALADAGSNADCPTALGSPSPEWSKAVAAALQALSDIPAGVVIMQDTDLELIGTAPTDLETYATVAKEMEDALPEIFSLRRSPPVIEDKTPKKDLPEPEFTAILDREGLATVTGPMRDMSSKTAAENFAAARFGKSQTNVSLKLSGAVPAGWSQRVLAAIDGLSYLNDGQVTMTINALMISGRSAVDGTQKIIEEALRSQLGSVPMDVSVEIVPELAKVSNGTSINARECERQLTNIMREAQIIFDPASSTISDQSELLLDEIGFIITSCPDAKFEIGGHTDSQGRDAMNLSLSQARADAVLDSLLSRDVLLDQIEAKGYGETEPIADNETEDGRARNRRIAFKLLPSEEVSDEQN